MSPPSSETFDPKELPSPYPLLQPLSPSESSLIAGNAKPETKRVVTHWLHLFMHRGSGFADSVGGKVEVTEISVYPKAEEVERVEGRVVCEVTVTPDMLNAMGNVHGACYIYLIDICSSLPLSVIGKEAGRDGQPGVSQSLNTVFHAPSQLGDRLKIVSTSITVGVRVMSARCEVWNVTRHRLVASGVHAKMEASPAKL
ncbi:hypothetical protein JAAARDRAFT_52052 [Jaapia argillacea MUCL 33604]|uniref:Thioesterase domain-containing protein n=1 Tax=Jaapia argillacea MUCL 33604 TaxID=933084 RepID=A0A067QN44_9AGAM|nr:hypothetical protein JAAARDRAFT_52052 [Jaapia argillacea MUCL 33604]